MKKIRTVYIRTYFDKRYNDVCSVFTRAIGFKYVFWYAPYVPLVHRDISDGRSAWYPQDDHTKWFRVTTITIYFDRRRLKRKAEPNPLAPLIAVSNAIWRAIPAAVVRLVFETEQKRRVYSSKEYLRNEEGSGSLPVRCSKAIFKRELKIIFRRLFFVIFGGRFEEDAF